MSLPNRDYAGNAESARRLCRDLRRLIGTYLRNRSSGARVEGQPDAQESTECIRPVPPAWAGDTVLMLRWYVNEATGQLANVGYQLEIRADEIDGEARAQLRHDLILLEEELTIVAALLDEPIDWDVENTRLLTGEIPPFEDDDDDGFGQPWQP